MGQRLISLKSDGGWRGKSTLSVTDRGQRKLLKLENGYVSGDGSEIRHFPGYTTLIDLSQENNPNGGYSRYITDAVRPAFSSTPNAYYQFGYEGYDSRRQTMWARAKPLYFHGFEQINKQVIIWGESRFREVPIYNSSRTQVVPASITVTGGHWVVTMTGSPGALSDFDSAGAGLNGLEVGDVVYTEGITVADATLQAAIDSNLNGRGHQVKAIATTSVTLYTTTSASASAVAVTAGEMHVVRGPRKDEISTPIGMPVFGGLRRFACDDPPALTSWRITQAIVGQSNSIECYPAWVANRQRDFGDELSAFRAEGIITNALPRGQSRRLQRPLPYRTNPESAFDRLILAAPGYGCMFQIPLKVPANSEDYPTSPTEASAGIPYWANGPLDKPRALGIPKARILDDVFTPVQDSPGQGYDNGYSHLTRPVTVSADGLPPGDYEFSIAFEDDALGEEGLASESVRVNIPSNAYGYTLRITYMHPGYVMPECLANRVNVYVSQPDTDAMVLYGSYPLCLIGAGVDADVPTGGVKSTEINGTFGRLSGVYGWTRNTWLNTPNTQDCLWRTIHLPRNPQFFLEGDVNLEQRLAPQSASMPRGAEACRNIRGVLLSGGALGNTGPNLEMWRSRASAAYYEFVTDQPFRDINRIHIWTYGQQDYSHPNTATDDPLAEDPSILGCAAQKFPDAYQGVEAFSKALFPDGSWQRVDRVMNPRARVVQDFGEPSITNDKTGAHTESIQTTRQLWGNRFPTSGTPGAAIDLDERNKDIWFLMPRGQLQIGDPGAPWRASKTAIQFIDSNRASDIVAIGNLSGTAVICSQRETYAYAWSRNPSGEVPQLLTNEHGCVGANTMVEFDGGLAWIGERGPVAMGNGLQFVGLDIQEDFVGSTLRYLKDSRGMMRHSWGCHDPSRGLVMWGLVTSSNTNEIEVYDSRYPASVNWATATDQDKSRWPCDEVLIWSYRVNAFSTWRPPAGLEILWMRPIDGRICFLAVDGRIYVLDDKYGDTRTSELIWQATERVANSTSITVPAVSVDDGTGRDDDFVRVGMLVEILNENKDVVFQTSVATVPATTGANKAITVSAAVTIKSGYWIRIGGRQPLTIVSSFAGSEALDNLNVQSVQMRYSQIGEGWANAKVTLKKTDRDGTKEVAATNSNWEYLGAGSADLLAVSQRTSFKTGGCDAPEVAVQVEISGSTQTRIGDLMLEVG